MKRTIRFFVVLLFVLLVVLLINVARLPSASLAPAAALPDVSLDYAAASQRFAHALRFRTLPSEPGAFDDFHAFLARSFPHVHAQLSRHTFGHSVLFHWQGQTDCAPRLLLAHQDVVPVDDAATWQHPPFAGVIDDDYVWGRGAMDDKGSLMAMLEAVESLLIAGERPECDVYLAFGHDEETGGRDGAAVMAAWLAEQGVRFSLVLDEGGMVLPGATLGLNKPVALLGVAEKGYMSVRLIARAQAGHSSRPPFRTAVGDLAAAITRLQQHPRDAQLHEPVKEMLVAVAPYQSFGKRLALANLWLFEPLIVRQLSAKPETNALLRTTLAPTMLRAGVKDNVLPARAEAVLNFRLAPGDSQAAVLAYLEKHLPDSISVSTEGLFLSDPSALSPTDSVAFQRLASLARRLPSQPVAVPFLLIAGTDARHYEHLSENVFRFLPIALQQEDLARFHGHNERLSHAQYAAMIRFYAALMQSAQ